MLLLILFFYSLTSSGADPNHEVNVTATSKCDFPLGFVFGAGTAAYNIEGGVSEGGRTPSIWDTFSHTPGKIEDGTSGDVAIDGYHRYKEIPRLLTDIGMNGYRFSISWSRIFPNGGNQVNPEGIAYYNSLIDELLSQGIKPYVTLYHWDLPQDLEDSLGGWLNPDIVPIFAKFAETCFSAFGDRVKYWTTINEPNIFAIFGYEHGLHPPGRCSPPSCSKGNSSTEPYIIAHNQLLAHAAATKIYKQNYQAKQRGLIGMAIVSNWWEPYSENAEDVAAAARALEFQLGWLANPLVYGDYPSVMRESVKERLPYFTEEESLLLTNSSDFLGINHYSSAYIAASACVDPSLSNMALLSDAGVTTTETRNGVPIGPHHASGWFNDVPWGFRSLVNHIKEKYNNPRIIILENGMEQNIDVTTNDTRRSVFYKNYLSNLLAAIREGAKVEGYFVWSLFDGWEWSRGYKYNFGLYHVNHSDNLSRHPKYSAKWFAEFLKHECGYADV